FHSDPVFDSLANNQVGATIDATDQWLYGDPYIHPTVGVNLELPSSDVGLTGSQQWNEMYKRLDTMGSGHPGGANAALADGSVRFVSNNISVTTIMAAATRSGGEVLGSDW